LADLPRKVTAEMALENSSAILVQKVEMLSIINEYAPEHLILQTSFNEELLNGIVNAGSVFIGEYTPESAGDYASGTNHTLPTNGFAKQYSGVSLDSFVKKITFQQISKNGIQHIGSAIEEMAAAEGLDAHKNAVTVRLKNIKA
jgi:histidinol dehydrogenase